MFSLDRVDWTQNHSRHSLYVKAPPQTMARIERI